MSKEQFKKRLEIVFTENDKDLWEWLEKKNPKATFIKKTLRDVMNNTVNEKIEQKIKEEIQKAISNTNIISHNKSNNNQQRSKSISLFQGREF